ncbi:MAG: hypothetical protein LRY46_00780, partial [Candidatus Pacebacteria bacterium]|nr:hypothetical protein [Candidatus Paceibacterota bacterium]
SRSIRRDTQVLLLESLVVKTDDIAKAAFDALVDPSEETLKNLARYGKTDTIVQAAKDTLNKKFERISHLIDIGRYS